MFTAKLRYLFVLLMAGSIAAAASTECLKREILVGTSATGLTEKSYRLNKTLRLRNLKNRVINGNNAKLIVTRPDIAAIELENCENLTLRNFTIDYDPLPYTQGTVTSVAGKNVSFAIDRGYRNLELNLAVNYLHVFEPTGRFLKKDCPDVYGKCRIVDSRNGIFQTSGNYPISVGDRVALNVRNPNCVTFRRCGKLTFERITVHASPGVAFHGRFLTGRCLFRQIRIVRGPKPENAENERLLASNADGVNLACGRGGALIEGCEFSLLGDDGINFHTELLPVAVKNGDRSFDTVYPYGKFKTFFEEVFQSGDRLVFVRPGDYAVIGEAKIVQIAESPRAKELSGRAAEFFPVRGTSGVSVYEVKLDRPLSVPEGSFFYVPASSISDFAVKNNYFHDHRARGIRIMSSQGVIAGNRFERIKHNAISLGGEFSHWREAGWAENIEIRDNSMHEIGYGMIDRSDSYVPGVISFFARLDRYPGTYRGNRNFIIAGNVIQDSPGAAIFFHLCEQVKLSGNQIRRCALSRKKPGGAYGWSGFAPVWSVDSAPVQSEKQKTENRK